MLSTENGPAVLTGGTFDKAGYMAMARASNTHLKAFLATDDPNGEGARWDAWTPEAKMSMVFDGDEGASIVGLKDVSKTYDQIIAEMEADGALPAELKDGVIKNVINGRWFSEAQDERFRSMPARDVPWGRAWRGPCSAQPCASEGVSPNKNAPNTSQLAFPQVFDVI